METIVQLLDEKTGNNVAPITHWNAVSNKPDLVTRSELSGVAQQGDNPDVSLTSIDEKIDDFYDTFDADMALQLSNIIGDTEESESDSESDESGSLTEELINRLNTLVDIMGSMEQRIEAFDGEVSDTYDFLESRGAVMPEDKTIENIPSTVSQIVDAHTMIPFTALTLPNDAEHTVFDLSNMNYLGTTVYTGHKTSYIKSFTCFYSTTMTGLNGFLQSATIEYADFSRLSDNRVITSFLNFAWNSTQLKEIDLSMIYTENITTYSRFFENCTALRKVNLQGFNFSITTSYGFENIFRNCGNLTWVNLLNTKATNATRDTYNGSVSGPTNVNATTFVGDTTYDEVKNQNLKIMEGVGTNINANYTIVVGGLNTNKASRLAMINGVADVTSSSYTLTLQMKTSDMSAEDLAIATNKGWSISSLG